MNKPINFLKIIEKLKSQPEFKKNSTRIISNSPEKIINLKKKIIERVKDRKKNDHNDIQKLPKQEEMPEKPMFQKNKNKNAEKIIAKEETPIPNNKTIKNLESENQKNSDFEKKNIEQLIIQEKNRYISPKNSNLKSNNYFLQKRKHQIIEKIGLKEEDFIELEQEIERSEHNKEIENSSSDFKYDLKDNSKESDDSKKALASWCFYNQKLIEKNKLFQPILKEKIKNEFSDEIREIKNQDKEFKKEEIDFEIIKKELKPKFKKKLKEIQTNLSDENLIKTECDLNPNKVNLKKNDEKIKKSDLLINKKNNSGLKNEQPFKQNIVKIIKGNEIISKTDKKDDNIIKNSENLHNNIEINNLNREEKNKKLKEYSNIKKMLGQTFSPRIENKKKNFSYHISKSPKTKKFSELKINDSDSMYKSDDSLLKGSIY